MTTRPPTVGHWATWRLLWTVPLSACAVDHLAAVDETIREARAAYNAAAARMRAAGLRDW